MKQVLLTSIVGLVAAKQGHHFAPLLNNGGKVESLSQYNYVADLRDSSGATVCGGSVVDESETGYETQWVVTAASCFYDADGQSLDIASMKVAIGSIDRVGGDEYGLAAVKVHPMYNVETHAFDLALARLDRPVDSKGVTGIKIGSAAPRPGTNITFVGFGDKYADGGVRQRMEHVGKPTGHHMAVLGPAHHLCAPAMRGLGLQHAQCTAFCVLQVTAGGPCNNDVGGATLVSEDHSLAGVTSQHGACGKKGQVSVATSLADKATWLECVRSGQPDFQCAKIGEDSDTCVAAGFSQATCAELDWTVRKGVCGASKVGGMCRRRASFHEAQDLCAAAGARLCRLQELADDVARGTGCGLDFRRVWTREPCGFDQDSEQMMSTGGSSVGRNPPRCSSTSSDVLLGVRCCADAAITGEVVLKTAPPPRLLGRKSASAMTCAQHGWKAGQGSAAVCAQSVFPLGNSQKPGCVAPKKGMQAQAFCAGRGARLCTSAELEADEALKSGCNLDVKRVWAADQCPLGGLVSQAGSRSYLPTHPKVCSAAGTTLNVRCCADVVSSNASPLSWWSCRDLGWKAKQGAEVCGSSLAGYGCSLGSDYAAAALKCSQAGSRMCTSDELMSDVAAGTGCQLDGRRVWSSTPCDGGVFTTAGAKKFSGKVERQCTPLHSIANVRCCADTRVLGPEDEGFPNTRPKNVPRPKA